MKAYGRAKISALSLIVFGGCTPPPPTSFSLNEEVGVYSQKAELKQQKIDFLWVIDNSNSMATSQQKVADSFQNFINEFVQRQYDFHIAVTTTDSWLAETDSDPSLSLFKDGTSATGFTGEPILTQVSEDLSSRFINHILQGVTGYGDERAFQSMISSLNNPGNSGFLREDAFLAIVVVSDEDDFSHDDRVFLGNNYSDPRLHPVSQYIDALDSIKGNGKYSVSSLGIFNESCLAQLQNEFPGRRIGTRYREIAELSGGITGDLCDDFAVIFEIISDTIVELTSSFPLEREPIVESLSVNVDGRVIEKNPINGWSYDASTTSIHFHGNEVPPRGANVSINYDPVTIKR